MKSDSNIPILGRTNIFLVQGYKSRRNTSRDSQENRALCEQEIANRAELRFDERERTETPMSTEHRVDAFSTESRGQRLHFGIERWGAAKEKKQFFLFLI